MDTPCYRNHVAILWNDPQRNKQKFDAIASDGHRDIEGKTGSLNRYVPQKEEGCADLPLFKPSTLKKRCILFDIDHPHHACHLMIDGVAVERPDTRIV